jgi:hypothetical protein
MNFTPRTARQKCHQNEDGKRRTLRACLQTVDFIGDFGSVTGARTRTLRLESNVSSVGATLHGRPLRDHLVSIVERLFKGSSAVDRIGCEPILW